MTREIEYPDEMIAMLEIIWGPGFMTPGGEGNVANLVEGLDLRDQRILDIGCGIGGPAFVLAEKYGANVVGIDIESDVIARARRRAKDLKVDSRCEFLLVEPGEFGCHHADRRQAAGIRRGPARAEARWCAHQL
jgi:phosphoethanolamine N-methyltransferase